MKKNTFISYLAVGVCMISSCTDNHELPVQDSTQAHIRVYTDAPDSVDASRAVITDSYLPDGAKIGTSVLQSSNKAVYNGYANVLWTASGTGSSQTWSTASDVKLSVTRCTCYGYYPYNPNVTDITQIPIEVASQTDYMYAHPYHDFWMGYPEAELYMKHALAVIRVTVKSGSTFSGPGDIQAFNMTGEFPATATLDATTGTLSNFQGKADAVALSGATLTTSGVTIEQIVIPDGETKTFNMGIRVDGKTYGLNSSYTHTIEAGNIYTYTVTINGTGASLSNVDIQPWTASNMNAQSVQVAPTVSVAGDTQNIAIATSLGNDDSVVITAVPVSDDLSVNEVSLTTSGTATMTQTFDESTGIRTITLQNVNSPSTVNFTGTKVSGYNLQTVYQVTASRSTVAAELLSSSPSFDLSKVTRMIVDGESVTPASSFDLAEGSHTVKYRFADDAVPAHIFDGVTALTAIELGTGISQISEYAFNGCSALQIESLPSTVTSVGDYAFAGCAALTGWVLPVTVTSLGNHVFDGCTSLASLVLPEGMSQIPEGFFAGCTGLTDIELPSTLTAIGANAFNGCSSLSVITTKALAAPSVDASSFTGVSASGTVYVESDATGYDTWLASGTGLAAWTQTVSNYYVVELNDQWQQSTVANPDASLYEGVYESFSNYNVNSTAALMRIKLKGYKTFTIYIRSYAESSYDYVMASQLDVTIDNNSSYSNTSLVKAHTRGNQRSGTTISDYTVVTYDIPDDGEEHTITVVYRKDGSGNNGTDRGYLLIGKQ